VALAAFSPSVIVFREEQNFDWWVYAFIAFTDAVIWGTLYCLGSAGAPPGTERGLSPELALALFLGLVLPVLLVVALLRMTTEVDHDHLRVWFGWIPTYRRTFSIGSVKKVEIVEYRPIADYGGWGIRLGRDGVRVLNARGNRGVRLELADGSKLLIGSQVPEQLARAIDQAMHPGT